MYHSQLWKWKIKNHQFRIIFFFFVIPKYLSLLFYVLSNIESIHSSGIICMRGEIFHAQHFPHIFVPISKGEWYGEFRHCNDRNNAVIDHLKIQKYTPPPLWNTFSLSKLYYYYMHMFFLPNMFHNVHVLQVRYISKFM